MLPLQASVLMKICFSLSPGSTCERVEQPFSFAMGRILIGDRLFPFLLRLCEAANLFALLRYAAKCSPPSRKETSLGLIKPCSVWRKVTSGAGYMYSTTGYSRWCDDARGRFQQEAWNVGCDPSRACEPPSIFTHFTPPSSAVSYSITSCWKELH